MAKSFNARMQDRFKTLTSNADKLNVYIHDTAMMIAEHAKEHGDCSTAQGLVMAMPASMRREMLILWFKTFTPIVVKNDPKFVAAMHKPASKMFVPWDLEAGKATPFYKLAEENKEKAPLTGEALLKMIEGLVKRAEKSIDDGKAEEADIPYIQAIARSLSGLKVERPAVVANDDKEPGEEKAA